MRGVNKNYCSVAFGIIFIIFLLGLIYSGTSESSSTNEWTMFHRGLNHSGVYPGVIDMTNFGKLWSYTMGNWSYSSSPAISQDILYIGSYDKKIYAVNATNGSLIWTYTTKGIVRSSPAVANNIVYAGSGDKNLYALNATDGTYIWNYTTKDAIYAPPTIYNDIVYIASSDNHTYAVNATNGTYIWNYTAKNQMATSSPAIVKDILYVGSHDYNLSAINATNGTLIWNYKTSGKIYSTPTVYNDVVYVGSNDRSLYAINSTNGSLIWNYPTGNFTYSSPIVFKGVVYVGVEGGVANDSYVLASNATDGTQIWNYTVADKIYSSPAIANDILFIGSNDYRMYVLNTTTGTPLWSYTTGGNIRSCPAIANGVVYIGSDDKNIYAFTSGQTDTTFPSIEIVSPVNDSESNDRVLDILYTRTEDVLISSCWYSNDSYSVNTTIDSCANLTSIIWAMGVGKHTLTIWINDSSGNVNHSTISFTITEPTSSSVGGSSSGTTSTTSTVTTAQTGSIAVAITVSSASSSVSVPIVSDHGTGVKEVEITSNSGGSLHGKLNLIAKNTSSLPYIINYSGEYVPYKFLTINTTLNESNIGNARIRVGISKSWISSNNVSEVKFVKAYPYYTELSSSLVSQNETEQVYDFYTSNFSTFAIIGVLPVFSNEEIADEEETNTDLQPLNWKNLLSWGIAIIIAVAIIIILFLRFRKKH